MMGPCDEPCGINPCLAWFSYLHRVVSHIRIIFRSTLDGELLGGHL